ncbi:MAG: hypothetical protein KY391_00950 [Actinobacteria bacterium]|nr:hypothetical protein [Actinomycetota bacterium]
MKWADDQSGVVLSWLFRVILFLAVVGVILFEVGSIVVNKVTLASSAEEAAASVSITISEQNVGGRIFPDSQIYDLAVTYIEDDANGVSDARVLRRGTEIDDQGIVHVRLRRRANTLVTHLIAPLEKHTLATETGQAGTN